MDGEVLKASTTPDALANYLKGLGSNHVHGDGRVVTLREDYYKRHHIKVLTTYEVYVDGQLLNIPLGVDNEGQLHCHSVPNYQFMSAIELIEFLIDTFPGDFSSNGAAPGHDEHGNHMHDAQEGE